MKYFDRITNILSKKYDLVLMAKLFGENRIQLTNWNTLVSNAHTNTHINNDHCMVIVSTCCKSQRKYLENSTDIKSNSKLHRPEGKQETILDG
ncbi:hypothetical protein QE152_g28415 [Popillia japonica]|uniref:Uncharacterized protein n=1 Tax=Popillia japonica TaxID=7064 RepID=A0AAW1JIV1_POPJA